MKNKKIIIMIITILLVVVIGASVVFILNKNNKTDENTNTGNTTESDTKSDVVVLDGNSTQAKLMSKLSALEETIGQDYLNFEKNNDIYFISLNDLHTKYNLDISEFVDDKNNVCDKDNSGLYFDVDHKIIPETNETNSILVASLVGCFEQENASSN